MQVKKVKPGQIWCRNYANDFHTLNVRVKIKSISDTKIVSEIISSGIDYRPVGMILTMGFDKNADPVKYKTHYEWYCESDGLSPEITTILAFISNYYD